jgi:hypothetical protein
MFIGLLDCPKSATILLESEAPALGVSFSLTESAACLADKTQSVMVLVQLVYNYFLGFRDLSGGVKFQAESIKPLFALL